MSGPHALQGLIPHKSFAIPSFVTIMSDIDSQGSLGCGMFEVSSREKVDSYCQFRPKAYKTVFMLNSAEHKIFSANKYEKANNSWHFHIY